MKVAYISQMFNGLNVLLYMFKWYTDVPGIPQTAKQLFRGVLRKCCAENMQQSCRGTPMRKCDFNKVALHGFRLGVLQ